MTTSQIHIVRAIRQLALEHRPVCIHSSLRSFGGIDGGPRTIIDAFLTEGATIIVPTFSWQFSAIPPNDQRPQRNGSNYEFSERAPTTSVYATTSSVIDDEMGALPAAALDYEERHRGSHPLCSFAAVGRMALDLVGAQQPANVWAPLESLALHGGAVLLMGVDFTKLTLVHLAEKRAGQRPFVRWALGSCGEVISVEAGGCSLGFQSFDAVLSPLSTTTQVGRSPWTCLPAKESLEVLVRAIRDRPQITRCDDPKCERCPDAIAGGPVM